MIGSLLLTFAYIAVTIAVFAAICMLIFIGLVWLCGGIADDTTPEESEIHLDAEPDEIDYSSDFEQVMFG